MDLAGGKGQFDLGEVLSIIWRRKWFIVIPTILVTAVAIAGSYFITPVYESYVIIWMGSSIRLSDSIERLVGDDLSPIGRSRNRNEELQSLKNEIASTPYIRQLVDLLRLDQDPELNKRAEKMREQWPHLSVDEIKFNLLLEDLREKIDIEFSGQDQVEISTQSTDPYKTRDMTKAIGEIFIAEKKKEQLGAVRVSQDFSYEQLEKYERDLQDKIDKRTEFERELSKIQLDDDVISGENRRNISSEIEATKNEIHDKEESVRQLMKGLAGIPNDNLTLPETDDIKGYRTGIKSLLNNISDMMLKYQWRSPEVLNFKARLYSLMDNIEAENGRLVKHKFDDQDSAAQRKLTDLFNLRSNLDMLYSKQNNLELALADLRNKIDLVPEYQARLDQLNREVTAATEIRDRLKQQQESAQISQAILQESEFKVVQPARLPLEPVSPDKKKLLIMGIVLGLVLGGGLAFLMELLDNSFRNVDDVEEQLNLPVLGVIPEIKVVKKAHLNK
jgi:succinoglycan biosynthesis transport protein ExoP